MRRPSTRRARPEAWRTRRPGREAVRARRERRVQVERAAVDGAARQVDAARVAVDRPHVGAQRGRHVGARAAVAEADRERRATTERAQLRRRRVRALRDVAAAAAVALLPRLHHAVAAARRRAGRRRARAAVAVTPGAVAPLGRLAHAVAAHATRDAAPGRARVAVRVRGVGAARRAVAQAHAAGEACACREAQAKLAPVARERARGRVEPGDARPAAAQPDHLPIVPDRVVATHAAAAVAEPARRRAPSRRVARRRRLARGAALATARGVGSEAAADAARGRVVALLVRVHHAVAAHGGGDTLAGSALAAPPQGRGARGAVGKRRPRLRSAHQCARHIAAVGFAQRAARLAR
eukprot:1813313-Prymnesium_polylepis.1